MVTSLRVLSFSVALVIIGLSHVPSGNGQLNPSAILQAIRGSFTSLTQGLTNVRSGNETDDSPISKNGTINVSQYRGAGVGPLNIFRTSNDNAAIVNEGLKDIAVLHFLGLAFGDEFPRIRDALVAQTKSNPNAGSITDFRTVVTNIQNWQYDRENNKKEALGPYTGLVPSLTFNPTGGDDNAK